MESSMEGQVITSPNPSKKILLLIALLVSIPLLVVLGVYLERNYLGSKGLGIISSYDTFFSSQSAFLSGKIIKASGNSLTVQNAQGQIKDFEVSEDLKINKFSETIPSTPSADLKLIDLNKDANINFEARGGKFKVVSIIYPAPVPVTTISPSTASATLQSSPPNRATPSLKTQPDSP